MVTETGEILNVFVVTPEYDEPFDRSDHVDPALVEICHCTPLELVDPTVN
jgi:hypothetical protein